MHNEELGNTKTNSSQKQRSRGWCFTLPNYSDEEYENIKKELHINTVKFVIGKEVAPSTGTEHLQGYAYFKNPQQITYLKKLNNRCHWEKAKGSPEQNLTYCTKEGNAVQNGFEKKETLQDKIKKKLLEKYENTTWKPWQTKIIESIDDAPDQRTINWVYDQNGNSGKSYLTKYLALCREVIIADGKKDNIFNQVKTKLVDEEKEFDLVILDIPRSSEGYVNYGVLEQLKNGLIYSGKYEGGMCLFDDVHVIVFANFMPDLSQFSQDRWNIIDISEEE